MNSKLYSRRDGCRLCNSNKVEPVLKLNPTPLANAFIKESRLGIEQAKFPLDIYFCSDCTHVQLLDVINPNVLFEHYVYVSGTSPVFVEHFEQYAKSILCRFGIGKSNNLVVDIGSNDGTLLRHFKKFGLQVLGIDPAKDIADLATKNGIETKPTFFSSEVALEILDRHGPAKIVCANNVFAHVDDLEDMTRGIRTLLAPDGIFVFEVSYLLDILQKTLFDTIYHEHVAYHSIGPLKRFFEKLGMEMILAERVDTHGGSLRGIVQLKGGRHHVDPSVKKLFLTELDIGINKVGALKRFAQEINKCKYELISYLARLKDQNKSIAAYGAPAKATTLMYNFEIGPNYIDFIVDDNPIKQGMFSPGMHIPIVSSEALYNLAPDAVIIFAWNFADSIAENHSLYLERGGEFLVPLPEFKKISLRA